VKVFLHIHDVDSLNGPLTLIPSSQSRKIIKENNYRWGGREGHLDEIKYKEIDNMGIEIVGKKKTVAFVDTSCVFHKGSNVKEGVRYIYYLQYITSTNFITNPIFYLFPQKIKSRLKTPQYIDYIKYLSKDSVTSVLSG
jgi:hypothetical protein